MPRPKWGAGLRARRDHDSPQSVPAGLSMALGSAYFRLGRYEDAEREYKAAVAVTVGKLGGGEDWVC